MRLERGLLPDEPGMEESYTIIPEDMRFCPTCPCPTRSCPNHGFCRYCKEHHDEIDRRLRAAGRGAEGIFCRRRERLSPETGKEG